MVIELFGILRKNFKIIFRSRISLVVLLLPVLLLIIIGGIYSQSKMEVLKIGTMPAVNQTSLDVFNILNFTNSGVGVERTPFSSKNDCFSALKQQEVDFCLRSYSEEGKMRIDVYTDMSRNVIAWRGYAVFENLVKYASREMVTSFIQKLLKELDSFSQNIDNLVFAFGNRTNNLEELRDRISSFRKDMRNMKLDTSMLEGVDDDLDALDAQVNMIYRSLNDYDDTIEEYQEKLTELEEALYEFETEKNSVLEELDETLGQIESDISSVKANLLLELYNPLCLEERILTDEQCTSFEQNFFLLDRSENQLGILRQEINSFDYDLSEIYDLISDTQDDLASTREDIILMKGKIRKSDSLLEGFKQDVEGLSEDLNAFEKRKKEIYQNIDDIAEDSDTFIKNMETISNQLLGLNTQLGDFIQVINPSDVSNPISFSFNGISLNQDIVSQDFSYILVSLIFLISVMSGLTFLINEKQSSSIVRNSVLPTSPKIVISYFLSIVFIVFIQALVILYLFNNFFLDNLLDIFTSLTFLVMLSIIALSVSFGLLIGSIFNKYENGMVVGVSLAGVLLLLSEKFVIPYSLPLFLANLIEYNPFSLAENLLRMALVNKLPFEHLFTLFSISFLLTIAFLVCAFVFFLFSSDRMTS